MFPTPSTAEVAYIQREFATVRMYSKNRNGNILKGVDFGESVQYDFFFFFY